MYENYGTSDNDINQALNYYGIPHDNLRKPYLQNTVLPNICILSMKLPRYGHWSLYYKGKYYDPEFGVLDYCPTNAEIHYYWEIYEEKDKQQRSLFLLPPLELLNDTPSHKIGSYKTPIRKIDSINYVYDSSKSYCGQACIAMLTGVPFEEIIDKMEHNAKITKAVLKKTLDHYGIKYAPKSTSYDSQVPLPELCIIRMKIPTGGHWGIYYKGTYYDPDYGVLDACPEQASIFQVWEIYP